MDGLPALQVPQMPDVANTAAKFLQLRQLRERNAAAADRSTDGVAATNTAFIKMMEFQATQKSAQRKEKIEASDFILNVLVGVNSEEDAEVAKGLINARYPQYTEMTNKIMSGYTPERVKLIRNSLRTEAQRLEAEEAAEKVTFGPAGAQPYKRGKEFGEQIPFKPTPPPKDTAITLTQKALKGDAEAINTLNAMAEQAEVTAEASAKGKIAGLLDVIDADATANLIIEGKETIENVRNTFGVPIQEAIRAKVLARDPNFNFVQPRAIVASLRSSLLQQQKNRGMMGSFVKNINRQVDKMETISADIVKRVGVRALDLPKREFITRFIGSGHERVFEAYMKEVSAEIAKLAQGSAASIAQLPEANRQEWEGIHDVNLSFGEILKVLQGTREMANIRLQSVEDEIDYTVDQMKNVRARKKTPLPTNKPLSEWTDEEVMRGMPGAQ